MKVWGVGRPQAEVRNGGGHAAIAQFDIDFLSAVKCKRHRRIAPILNLDLDLAGLVVERADEHLRLALDELHAVVESAVEVEVVVGARQLHARPRKDVVDRRENRVLASRDRPDRNLQPRVRVGMKPKVLAVQLELRPDAHSVHDENRVLHRLRKRERPAV